MDGLTMRKAKQNIYENAELCQQCGGKCCQLMGCHFSPDDFKDLSYEGLKKEIDTGYISIDWWEGDINKNRNEYSHIIFLRMRNKGASIVDASWGGSQCFLWTEEAGCPLPFSARPKGARLVRPGTDECPTDYSKEQCVWDWRPYQEVLIKLKNDYYVAKIETEFEKTLKILKSFDEFLNTLS